MTGPGAELVGWASAALLLATIVQQVWTQWKSGSTAGVSKWLFVGQTIASAGFTAYSAMTGNLIFTVVNAALLASGLTGEVIYWRNRRRKRARPSPQPCDASGSVGEQAPLRSRACRRGPSG